MLNKARRSAAVSIASLLTMAVSAVVWSQATPPGAAPGTAPATGPEAPAATLPATAPATATAPAVTRPAAPAATRAATQTETMVFRFENARVDTILSEMSARFGFIIIKDFQITTLVTIQAPKPVTGEEAIQLLNSVLFNVGYGTIQSRTEEGKTVLRIASLLVIKKLNVPIMNGADPAAIALTDTLITQIIPLKNVDAVRLLADLRPLLSADADVTANSNSNCIVVTDTSSKIHRLVEIIQNLDNQKIIKMETQYRQLIYSNAVDMARLLNAMFNPSNTGQNTGGGGGGGFGGGGATAAAPGVGGRGGAARGGGGGGGAAQLTGRLYADSDQRTNTVVLTGPAEQVAQALDMLTRIESIPIDLLNTSVFFIKHLKNAQCVDIVPVLNQIFGGGGGGGAIGGGGGARAGVGLTGTNTANRGGGGLGGTGGGLGGTGARGGGTGRGGNTSGGLGTGNADGLGGTTGTGESTSGDLGTAAGAGGARGGAAGGARGGAAGGAGVGAANRGNTGNVGRAGGAGTNTAASALAGAAYFVANSDTNSILVTTDNTYEERVRNIIDELDRPVPQVLIKVLVAEVTHTNGDDIGFEFGLNDNLRTSTDINGNNLVLGVLGGSDFGIKNSGGGFSIGLVESQVSATLRALAHQNKLEVLSRPYILAQDNQEAYMIIGQQVPYITNSQITNTGQTINSVSYTQVGIVLDVLPHVNPDGLVTMDIAPQVSQLDAGSGVPISSNVNAPTFTTRQAQSRVAIKNGETIVIGGLMQDQKQQIINKIPVLGDIPYLGMLFKRTTNEKVKTELLIFLTPHVAMTPDVLQKMSNEETNDLKLVPTAVQPGTFEQQMKGLGAGQTTTQPQTEIRIERGTLTPAPTP